MKVYISADIEGVGGVVNKGQAWSSGADYGRARKLMTEEVNAAVRGAAAAGADEILVNDSHGSMTNILIEELDPAARLVSGSLKALGMMERVDGGFDAALLVGYHARQGTGGVMSHSYNSGAVQELRVNGRVLGELELNALLAAHFGVPVVFASGDDVLAAQARAFDPGIAFLVVKEAISRNCADCMPLSRVRASMEAAVEAALRAPRPDPSARRIQGAVVVEQRFMNSGMAEICLLVPGVELVAGDTIRFESTNIVEAYKLKAALTILAGTTA